MIRIKRTYEAPARDDGKRILVERLWPRGMTRERVAADLWQKDVAPTTELRRWFSHREERWDEFRRRYRQELDANPSAWRPILEAAQRATVTLLYSAHDPLHNGAIVLRDYLMERAADARRRTSRAADRARSPARDRKSKVTASPRARNTSSRAVRRGTGSRSTARRAGA